MLQNMQNNDSRNFAKLETSQIIRRRLWQQVHRVYPTTLLGRPCYNLSVFSLKRPLQIPQIIDADSIAIIGSEERHRSERDAALPLKGQTAVTAHFSSEQLLPFALCAAVQRSITHRCHQRGLSL